MLDRVFSNIELDATKEIINIGIGEAAFSMAELVNQKIQISVSDLSILDQKDLVEKFSQLSEFDGVFVYQDFIEGFNGKAVLAYSKKNSELLLSSIFGIHKDVENFDVLELSSVEELGNIILGSCVSKIADTMNTNVHFLMPKAQLNINKALLLTIDNNYDYAILIESNLKIGNTEIFSEIILLFKVKEFLNIVKEITNQFNQANN